MNLTYLCTCKTPVHIKEISLQLKKKPLFSYLSDMDDLDITCSDFVNALKILIRSEKLSVSRAANHGYAKKVIIDNL